MAEIDGLLTGTGKNLARQRKKITTEHNKLKPEEVDNSYTNWDLILEHRCPPALWRSPGSFSEVGKAGESHPGESERGRDKRTEEEAKGRAASALRCESLGTVKGVNHGCHLGFVGTVFCFHPRISKPLTAIN